MSDIFHLKISPRPVVDEAKLLRAARETQTNYPRGSNHGRCVEACVDILTLLGLPDPGEGVVTGLFDGTVHTWIEVYIEGRGIMALDTTLTQFGGHLPDLVFLPREMYRAQCVRWQENICHHDRRATPVIRVCPLGQRTYEYQCTKCGIKGWSLDPMPPWEDE